MGKIHDEMKAAFDNCVEMRKGNDCVYKALDGHGRELMMWSYHGNDIAKRIIETGETFINTCGWGAHTSTRARIYKFGTYFVKDGTVWRYGVSWSDSNHWQSLSDQVKYSDFVWYIENCKTNLRILRHYIDSFAITGQPKAAKAALAKSKELHPRADFTFIQNKVERYAR